MGAEGSSGPLLSSSLPAAPLTFGKSLHTDWKNGAILQKNTEFREQECTTVLMKATGLSSHPPRQALEVNTSLTRNISKILD